MNRLLWNFLEGFGVVKGILVYVTVRLWNQGFHEITKAFSEFMKLLFHLWIHELTKITRDFTKLLKIAVSFYTVTYCKLPDITFWKLTDVTITCFTNKALPVSQSCLQYSIQTKWSTERADLLVQEWLWLWLWVWLLPLHNPQSQSTKFVAVCIDNMHEWM